MTPRSKQAHAARVTGPLLGNMEARWSSDDVTACAGAGIHPQRPGEELNHGEAQWRSVGFGLQQRPPIRAGMLGNV